MAFKMKSPKVKRQMKLETLCSNHVQTGKQNCNKHDQMKLLDFQLKNLGYEIPCTVEQYHRLKPDCDTLRLYLEFFELLYGIHNQLHLIYQ